MIMITFMSSSTADPSGAEERSFSPLQHTKNTFWYFEYRNNGGYLSAQVEWRQIQVL